MSKYKRRPRLRVLLDTGPLYALLDDRDGKHRTAVNVLEGLEVQAADIACAYPAFLETHRLILTRQRVTANHAHALIAGAFEVFTPEMPLREDADTAIANLERYRDQKISLADAVIAAMAKRLQRSVVTFDLKSRHFEMMDARVYLDPPGRIGW